MTQVHFTMTAEDIQSLIQQSVENDVSKKILTMVFNQLMEQERSDYINASDYERSEERVSYRNGYYERDFTTRVGTLELRVPRTRDGKFSPSVFERYQRNEKALLAAMLEMYISGVSTRKVTKLVEELCGKKISKSLVSTLTKDLDEIVAKWQHSSLNNECYPYLMVDVIYLKVREEERVISKSCHIAIGFSQEGGRKVLGFLITVKCKKNFTCIRHITKSQDFYRSRRTCFFNPASLIIHHGTNLTIACSCCNKVSHMKSTFLDKDRGNRTFTFIKLSLDYKTSCGTVRICL